MRPFLLRASLFLASVALAVAGLWPLSFREAAALLWAYIAGIWFCDASEAYFRRL